MGDEWIWYKKSSNECDADMTLLMHASYGGYLESVKVLVKNRADVNVKSKLGATALKLAKIKVIEDLLIAFGSKE